MTKEKGEGASDYEGVKKEEDRVIGTKEERMKFLDQMYPVWEPLTLWQRFRKNAVRFEKHPFIIYQDQEITYGEALRKTEQIALSLYRLGVGPGDHVAVLLYNCPEFVYLTYALSKLGAVKVPVNANVKREEFACIETDADISYVICERENSPDFFSDMDELQKIVVMEGKAFCTDRMITWEKLLRLSQEEGEGEAAGIEAEQDPEGLSDIIFTSGSTARPKGVCITHDMLLRSSFATCRTRCMEEGRRIMVPIPLHHIFAYSEGLLAGVYIGGCLILSDQKFSPKETLRLMREHGANDIICVSFVMLKILSECKPKPKDYPRLHAAYWASTCPEWVWDTGRKAFGIMDVTTGYGMTECGSTSTMMSPVDPPDLVKHFVGRLKEAGSAGLKELGGRLMAIRICDPETGEMVKTKETGEIQCKGPTVTKGYYKNPAANQASYTSDGWFRTGDMGCFNEEGYLTFQGRNNDMYKINGENVSPQYLDVVIGKCPLVKAVECVGIRHERYGEVGVAFIEPADDSGEVKDQIEEYCRQNLTSFQVPGHFIYSRQSSWPKTASSKIQKSRLRRLAEERLQVMENR